MKDRIQKFMDYKNIAPGELADILDVQRSNVSHILNGRNKPGASFTEKMLIAFPELNARWLFTGDGSMLMGAEYAAKDVREQPEPPEVRSEPPAPYQRRIESPGAVPHDSNKKSVEKVVLLYSDGTFVSYTPG